MEKEEITARITTIAQEAAGHFGLCLVDVELKGTERYGIVRVFIDRTINITSEGNPDDKLSSGINNGVTIEDCASVSRQMSAALDVEDLFIGRYTLEVSSPGLDRPLKSPKDYVRNIGKLVRIKTTTPLKTDEKNKATLYIGRLTGVSEDGITIVTTADKKILGMTGNKHARHHIGEESKKIEFSNISKGRLEIEV